MAMKATTKKQPKAIASTQSLSTFVKTICDVMRRSNCASALQYVPELTWILFLRILDAQESRDQDKAEAVGATFTPALRSPYRWQDWAAPYSDKPGHPKTAEGKPYGWKRQELFSAGDGKLFDFIHKELLPHLHSLGIDIRTGLPNPSASRKQRIIGRIMTAVEQVRGKTQANQTHFAVGRKVRQTIKELGGTMPESLPKPDSSIQQIESAKKKLEKKKPGK